MLSLKHYTAVSFIAAAAVVYHAFATRRHFYPATVQLSTSKLAIAAMGNCAFATTLCIYRITIKVFLGNLREVELERINERLSSAIMETCLALTIFREEFNLSFVAMFAILAFIKVFHWLVQDRVEYIEVTPTVSRLQHVRIVSFMFVLLCIDGLFLQYAVSSTLQSGGQSVQLLFAFEYVIQLTTVISTFLKYTLSMADSWMEGRWEAKGTYVFYLELVTDMVHLFVYCIFFFIVFTHYGLPLHLVRDLYMTFRNFRNRIVDFLRFRQVTARMDRFPDATAADLERCDGVCIICREEMAAAGSNKKLPCGHVFHLHCLRSWLERQQNCPTCRANVFRPRAEEEGAAEGQEAANGAAGAAAAAAGAAQVPDVEQQPAAAAPGAAAAQAPPAGAAAPPRAPPMGPAGAARAPPPRQPRRPGVHPGPPPFPPPYAASEPPPTNAVPPPGPQGYWAQPLPAGLVWQMPQWYPVNPMVAFPTPMQYAGQQTAESSTGMPGLANLGLAGLPGMIPGLIPAMVPLPVIPALSAPFAMMPAPLPPGTTPEQQQAHTQAAIAAIMAAAAATAVYNPFAGLAMMPPAMLAPAVPAVPPPAGPSTAAAGPETSGAAGTAGTAGAAPRGPTPDEVGQLLTRQVTTAAAALMGGDPNSFNASVEATQRVLMQQIEMLQGHVDRLNRMPAAPGAGPSTSSAATAAQPADAGPATAVTAAPAASAAGGSGSQAAEITPAEDEAQASTSGAGSPAVSQVPTSSEASDPQSELRRRRLAKFGDGTA